MYNLFTRHHLTPGEFWEKPRGEQVLLLAFSDYEIEDQEKWLKEVNKNYGR